MKVQERIAGLLFMAFGLILIIAIAGEARSRSPIEPLPQPVHHVQRQALVDGRRRVAVRAPSPRETRCCATCATGGRAGNPRTRRTPRVAPFARHRGVLNRITRDQA